jgi:hypothetical protein
LKPIEIDVLNAFKVFKSYRRDENWGFGFPVSLVPCQRSVRALRLPTGSQDAANAFPKHLQPFFKRYF